MNILGYAIAFVMMVVTIIQVTLLFAAPVVAIFLLMLLLE